MSRRSRARVTQPLSAASKENEPPPPTRSAARRRLPPAAAAAPLPENDDLLARSLEEMILLLLPMTAKRARGGAAELADGPGGRGARGFHRVAAAVCRARVAGLGRRRRSRRRMIRVLQPHIITATTIINISRWNMRNLLLHLSWKEIYFRSSWFKSCGFAQL